MHENRLWQSPYMVNVYIIGINWNCSINNPIFIKKVTFARKPLLLFYFLSTNNRQLSTINCQLSTIRSQLKLVSIFQQDPAISQDWFLGNRIYPGYLIPVGSCRNIEFDIVPIPDRFGGCRAEYFFSIPVEDHRTEIFVLAYSGKIYIIIDSVCIRRNYIVYKKCIIFCGGKTRLIFYPYKDYIIHVRYHVGKDIGRLPTDATIDGIL